MIGTIHERLRRGFPGWRSEQEAVLLAAFLLLGHFVIALALIPPWQQPDEPTHVAIVERQRTAFAALAGPGQPGREREILDSMMRHHWWEHRAIGFETPAVAPETFTVRVGVPSENFTRPTTYYLAAGRLLAWLPRMAVVDDLYILRGASAILGLLTLWVAWRAGRECLGPLAAATTTMLLALHPQFAIVSTSVSPDVVVNLLGACVWWQSAVVLRRNRARGAIVAVWAAAILAVSADRMGMPLVATAFVLSVVVMWRRLASGGRRPLIVAAVVAILGVMALGAALWALEAFGTTYGWRRALFGSLTPVPGAVSWSAFARFTWLLHQSWWFTLGQGRYAPAGWWLLIAVVVTAAAAAGVGRRLFDAETTDPGPRATVAFAVTAIAIQLAAVYWAYFRLGTGGQGRYLFPCLVPSLLLLWAGIEAWVPPPRRAKAAAALVLLVTLLDFAVWIGVAIPAYYESH